MWTNRTLELNGIRYIIDQNGYVTLKQTLDIYSKIKMVIGHIKENGPSYTGLRIINHQKPLLIQLENKPKENNFCLMESTISSMNTGAMFVNKFHK